jgi:hypothetical protein
VVFFLPFGAPLPVDFGFGAAFFGFVLATRFFGAVDLADFFAGFFFAGALFAGVFLAGFRLVDVFLTTRFLDRDGLVVFLAGFRLVVVLATRFLGLLAAAFLPVVLRFLGVLLVVFFIIPPPVPAAGRVARARG